MALFKKKPATEGDKGPVVGFTKPKKFLFFRAKSVPIYAKDQKTVQQPSATTTPFAGITLGKPGKTQPAVDQDTQKAFRTFEPPTKGEQKQKKLTAFQFFIANTASKHKGLDVALREQGIRSTPYAFVKRMFFSALAIAVIVGAATSVLLQKLGVPFILGIVLGLAMFFGLFNKFLDYPVARGKNVGNEIERDILFAARDMVIGMRSGMPLFNAFTMVSSGRGAASREFGKVVELAELGMPIAQAIDEVSAKSGSKTFKRLMLQASVSIKAGADVVGALQGVTDEVMQERVIELRRYGQRLNALAMFYMLFGVIFPSMGIAVGVIMTTFISLFTFNYTTLIFALVGITFLQFVFLNMIRSSRPVFAT